MKRACRLGVAAIAGAGSIALLAGCSLSDELFGENVPIRDPENVSITQGGDLPVLALEIGDCFDDTATGPIGEVPVVPCAGPHDNEIYFEFKMPAGEYPGDAAVEAAADEICLAQFEPFAGITSEDLGLAYSFLTPMEGSWRQGNRAIQCMIFEPGVRVEGTLMGAAR